jgi:hypothetical protein
VKENSFLVLDVENDLEIADWSIVLKANDRTFSDLLLEEVKNETFSFLKNKGMGTETFFPLFVVFGRETAQVVLFNRQYVSSVIGFLVPNLMLGMSLHSLSAVREYLLSDSFLQVLFQSIFSLGTNGLPALERGSSVGRNLMAYRMGDVDTKIGSFAITETRAIDILRSVSLEYASSPENFNKFAFFEKSTLLRLNKSIFPIEKVLSFSF